MLHADNKMFHKLHWNA